MRSCLLAVPDLAVPQTLPATWDDCPDAVCGTNASCLLRETLPQQEVTAGTALGVLEWCGGDASQCWDNRARLPIKTPTILDVSLS